MLSQNKTREHKKPDAMVCAAGRWLVESFAENRSWEPLKDD